MAVTDHKPRGLLRLALRAPIWLYRANLGWLTGRRLLYVAHRGRRTGARREVVAETVRYDPSVPEAVVVAAWGKNPDWLRNLRAAPPSRSGWARTAARAGAPVPGAGGDAADAARLPAGAPARVEAARAAARLPHRPGRPGLAGGRRGRPRDRLQPT